MPLPTVIRILHITTFLSMLSFNLFLPFIIKETCKRQVRLCETINDEINCQNVSYPDTIKFCVKTSSTEEIEHCTDNCQSGLEFYLILYIIFIITFFVTRTKYINNFTTNILNGLLLGCYISSLSNNLSISNECSKRVHQAFYIYPQDFYKYCRLDSFVIVTSSASFIMIFLFILLEKMQQTLSASKKADVYTPLLSTTTRVSAPPLTPDTLNGVLEQSPTPLSPSPPPYSESIINYPDLRKIELY